MPANEHFKEDIKIDDVEMQENKPADYQATSDTLPDITRNVLRRGPIGYVNAGITYIETTVTLFIEEQQKPMKITVSFLAMLLFTIYFVFAVSIDFERARDLVYITVFSVFCFLYWLLKKYFGKTIWENCMEPMLNAMAERWVFFKWFGIGAFFLFVLVWIIVDTSKQPSRLISLAGLFIYIVIGFLFSKNREQVIWRPVVWGFALQFIFGLLILRTSIGYEFFNWLGERINIFLSFSMYGIRFMFRPLVPMNIFAINILPVIIYFSAVAYLIYYLGAMQVIIKKIAWLLHVTMGTSPSESVSAAGNIFIGQTEAPLLIRPFLKTMTESELHAVMTGGFATIAGSVFAAYLSFGVSPTHLLSASVMSAPAALAISKLMYPETEEPEFKNVDEIVIEKTEEKNALEALAVGASMSIALVANIAVMLIAFLSVLALANGILMWLGSMVNQQGFTFEFICSYVLMPFAYIMGVEWEDSFVVAELLGLKTFLNEFVAYQKLGDYIDNRLKNTSGTKLSVRSEVISTYALCGFSNFGSMGIQLGGLAVLAPNKRTILSKLVLRALFAGTLACFMTACVAGVLYEEISPLPTNSTMKTNSTVNGTLF